MTQLSLLAIGGFSAMLNPAARHLSQPDSPARFLRVHDRGKTGPRREEIRTAWHTHGAELVSDFEALIGDGKADALFVCGGKNADDFHILKEVVPLMGKAGIRILVHMSTVSPRFSQAADMYCTRHGVCAFFSPLTGGVGGAENATMLMLTCGPRHVYDSLEPTLKCLGTPLYYGNDATAGAKVKLIGHAMVGNGLIGISSAASLHAACFQEHQLGGAQTAFFDTLNKGAGGTMQWDRALRPGIDENDFKTGFKLKHAIVDMVYLAELMRQEGQSLLSILPVLNIVLGYAFALHHSDPSQEFATHSVVLAMLADKKDQVNSFVRNHLEFSNTHLAIAKCVKALPDHVRESVMLDVNFDVE